MAGTGIAAVSDEDILAAAMSLTDIDRRTTLRALSAPMLEGKDGKVNFGTYATQLQAYLLIFNPHAYAIAMRILPNGEAAAGDDDGENGDDDADEEAGENEASGQLALFSAILAGLGSLKTALLTDTRIGDGTQLLDKIRRKYIRKTCTSRALLGEEFTQIKMGDDEDLEEYIERFIALTDRFTHAGRPKDAESRMTRLIMSLTPEYEKLQTSILDGNFMEKTWDEMLEIVRDRALQLDRLANRKTGHAFVACWDCGKEGHIARNCTENDRRQRRSRRQTRREKRRPKQTRRRRRQRRDYESEEDTDASEESNSEDESSKRKTKKDLNKIKAKKDLGTINFARARHAIRHRAPPGEGEYIVKARLARCKTRAKKKTSAQEAHATARKAVIPAAEAEVWWASATVVIYSIIVTVMQAGFATWEATVTGVMPTTSMSAPLVPDDPTTSDTVSQLLYSDKLDTVGATERWTPG